MENTPLIGRRREGSKLVNLSEGDAWGESPFFGPLTEGKGSEHVTAIEEGQSICGIFHGLRISNKKGPESAQNDYAVFMTEDGDRFRMFTPGQLRYQLSTNVKVGQYVEITYLGKKYVEDLDRDVHQFTVLADEGALN
jgi:hypothetical protein